MHTDITKCVKGGGKWCSLFKTATSLSMRPEEENEICNCIIFDFSILQGLLEDFLLIPFPCRLLALFSFLLRLILKFAQRA